MDVHVSVLILFTGGEHKKGASDGSEEGSGNEGEMKREGEREKNKGEGKEECQWETVEGETKEAEIVRKGKAKGSKKSDGELKHEENEDNNSSIRTSNLAIN